MSRSTLDAFVDDVRNIWGPISSDIVQGTRAALDRLTASDEREPWLRSLLDERPATRELHRDKANGFMLLAHSEQEGLYRSPHDHGRSWVCYAVQSGELEIGTYARIPTEDSSRLVLRETHILRPGAARIYLPADIHDTRCVSQGALVFRFTERDLRHEDQVEHRLTRFVSMNGDWVAPGANH